MYHEIYLLFLLINHFCISRPLIYTYKERFNLQIIHSSTRIETNDQNDRSDEQVVVL